MKEKDLFDLEVDFAAQNYKASETLDGEALTFELYEHNGTAVKVTKDGKEILSVMGPALRLMHDHDFDEDDVSLVWALTAAIARTQKEKRLIAFLLKHNNPEKLQELMEMYPLGDYDFDFGSGSGNQLASIVATFSSSTQAFNYIPSEFHRDCVRRLIRRVIEVDKEICDRL